MSQRSGSWGSDVVSALRNNVVVVAEDGRLKDLAAHLRMDGHEVRLASRPWEMIQIATSWPAHVVVLEMRRDTLHNVPLLEPLSLMSDLQLLVIADRELPDDSLSLIRKLGLLVFHEPLPMEEVRAAVFHARPR